MAEPQAPRFVRREAFEVVGIEGRTSKANNRIPKLWDAFTGREDDIRHREDLDVFFGLCIMDDGHDTGRNNAEEEFTAFVGVEVSKAEDLPEGMVTRSVPAADYVVFLHKGAFFPDGLPKTYEFIYKEWFPKSQHKPADKYDFEFYDRRFCGVDNPNTVIEIWVPIKVG